MQVCHRQQLETLSLMSAVPSAMFESWYRWKFSAHLLVHRFTGILTQYPSDSYKLTLNVAEFEPGAKDRDTELHL